MEKEKYEKPEIRTEEIEFGSFGTYGGPVNIEQPNFGICCS
jgi:hypothetical protein